MHGRQPDGRYGMQAVESVNIAKMKCNRKRKSRGKWIVISKAGRDNWIGHSEAIVTQAIHEAMRYIYTSDHCDSIQTESSNYMCI